MLFFQLALLAGYAYAHLIDRSLNQKRASWIHRILLIASILLLPILPSDAWKPRDGSLPLWRILALLTVVVGGPYSLLSSSSPLLQSWFRRVHPAGLPYRFFALSNLGSMLALITYPLWIEPHIPLRTQAWVWSAGYLVFASLCFWIAGDFQPRERIRTAPLADLPGTAPTWKQYLEWVALAGCASGLLLAITNHITQNVAAIPFLWLLPLSLYLLSFILTFDSDRWYQRRLFLGVFAVSIGSMSYAVAQQIHIRDLRVLLPLFSVGLFACCMVCHGELARRKPSPQFLTQFYLLIAAGGALGGLFVAVLAPGIFPALFEFPILLIATPLIVLILLGREAPSGKDRTREWERSQFWTTWASALFGLVALSGYLIKGQYDYFSGARLLVRNFYGALSVIEDDELGLRQLAHGTINHGEQYSDPMRRRQPITYYAPKTGIGLLLTDMERRGPMRLGVVGLGTGTMAAWARPGDSIRFYEINPTVAEVAHSEFTYLRDCAARLDLVPGDARLSMEREPSQQFDVLAVDAFSGDSIPIHLLTREAFRVYWRQLRPDGVLAIHTSNKYLELAPPVALLASESGREAHLIESERDDATRTFASDWVLIGFDERKRFPWIEEEELPIDAKPNLRPWTDDFSNLWQTLR